MKRKLFRIGIATPEEYQRRSIAIAKGEYTPTKNEPKVWFESIETLAQTLSRQNVELLRIIKENEPKSLADLTKISGRKTSDLSRTLHTLERYGIVELQKGKRAARPVVKATDFKVTMGLYPPWRARRNIGEEILESIRAIKRGEGTRREIL